MKEFRSKTPQDLVKVIGVSINDDLEPSYEQVMAMVTPTLRKKFKAIIELYKRSKEKPKSEIIDGADAAMSVFRPLLSDLENEEVWAMFLDSNNRKIAVEKICSGGCYSCCLDVRIIATKALGHKARSVIVSHNHIGHSSMPSESDIKQTKKLKDGLGTIDVRLIDHIIVAKSECYSFVDECVTLNE